MNLKLLEYSLLSLFRRKGKNFFIFVTLTVLIAISLSMFTITAALKKEALYSVENLPDITVQKITGGRQQYLRKDIAEEIILLPGVTGAYPRIWGFYSFEYLNTNLTIAGIDIFNPHVSKTLKKITEDIDPKTVTSSETIYVGEKLRSIINQVYGKDEFSFQKPDGTYITREIAGTFKTASAMISTDTVLTDLQTAAEILGISDELCTDIAVNVSNPQEISTAAEKISNISPALRVITKEVIEASYQNMFDFKGGIFLLFFITSLFTFFMIIFDRLSGLTGLEVKEIAILKALGWGTSDILKVKIYESAITAVSAFLSGTFLSLVYVYLMSAPGLKNIFTGYSYLKPAFDLPFSFDLTVYISVFFVTVPVYGAAVLIPSWRASITDAGEVIR